MPRVVFVNEHRVVEAELGKSVHDVASEAGVALGRKGMVWIEEGTPVAAGPRTWIETVRGLRGWRRLARKARVLGDLKVHSSAAGASRVGQARVIAEVPSPVSDPTAPRKPDDAASTAAHVHGHPSAVGRGIGEVAKEIPEAPPSRANAARPISTVPPPMGGDGEGEDGVL